MLASILVRSPMQAFRYGRHSVSRITIQLVCVTKYRRKVLDPAALAWLGQHFAKVCETMRCELLACGGEADHVHILIEYPPTVPVSVLVNALKGTSSRLLRKERGDIARRYRDDAALWSPSYLAASTGSDTLDVVKRYVEQQRASSSP